MTSRLDEDDDQQDKPLDPAVERVRRKLVRFMAVNLGLLFLAVMAVVAAIVYRSATREDVAKVQAPEPVEARLLLPQGGELVDQSVSDGRLLLTIRLSDGNTALYLYDAATGAPLGRYELSFEGR